MYSYDMFVRVRKQPGKDRMIPYAYLVDNHWNPFHKKNEQKIVASLGRVENLPIDGTVEKIIVALDNFANKMGFASLSDGIVLQNISLNEDFLSKVFDWGIINLVKQILKNLSLDKIISGSQAYAKQKEIALYKFMTAVTALLSHRLIPQSDISERAACSWYQNHIFLPRKQTLLKDDFYRALDILEESKDEIEKAYYEKNLNLFSGKLDLVLFDTTSIYYYGAEGEVNENSILQYGFSKDGKNNLKQVIVGVLMTSDGIPIAHEVFPGNTADVKAFNQMITVIKKKYPVGKIILIADRGMVSEENIIHLEQSGLSYIVGIRMRVLSQKLKKKLLIPLDDGDPTDDMDKISDNLYSREFKLDKLSADELKELFVDKIIKGKTATFNGEDILKSVLNRRFFVCLNPYIQEAAKKKREYFKHIIQNKIKNTPTKEWVIKNGYKKYLKFEKGLEPVLDEERLKDEEIYDGKWVIMTNEKTISSYMAGTYYKSLQNIERGFKDLKSLISIRPIYHFKEERIRAHIFICFLVLIIKWYICRMINPNSQEEGRRFIEEMNDLKAVAIDPAIPLYMRTIINPETQKNMKKLKMMIPSKVIIDGRRKVNAPISKRGGRPRKDRSLNQIKLPIS